MAATNVQAFSGDLDIAGAITSNLEVGTANLFVDTLTGRVGIGTDDPGTKLHLLGVGTGSGPKLRFETLNNGNGDYTVSGTEIGRIQFGADDFSWATQHMSSEIVGIHDTPNYSGARGILAFKTSSSQGSDPAERMRIRYDGNVGIGTNNPAHKLSVNGGHIQTINDSGSNDIMGLFSASYGDFLHIGAWNAGGSESKNIAMNYIGGNVGIGTTNPVYKLQVTGNTYLTNSYIGGARYVTNRNSQGRILFSGSQDSKWIGRGNNASDIHFTRSDNNNMLVVYYGGISKAGGTFDIKHPLSKIGRRDRLRHSFIEGPRADNIYRGVVELVSGNATVNMCTDSVESPDCAMRPGTFTALNKNHQFFLQNVSDFDRVKGRLDGETLTIESENPTSNSAVSWMVVGERQDEHMRDLASDMTNDNGSIVTEYIQDETDLPDSDVQEEEEDEADLQ
jgi:hypothetical protein